MKYTPKERLDIGRRIYLGELTLATAAYAYDINMYTARDYLRMYKASAQLTTYDRQDKSTIDMEHLRHMTKEELIAEVIKAKEENLQRQG